MGRSVRNGDGPGDPSTGGNLPCGSVYIGAYRGEVGKVVVKVRESRDWACLLSKG